MGAVEDICPDCRLPVSTHEMYPFKRCPVIRLTWKLPVSLDEMVPRGYVEMRDENGRLQCRQRFC